MTGPGRILSIAGVWRTGCWLRLSQRQWFGWNAEVGRDGTLRATVEVAGWPTALGSLDWLLPAARCRGTLSGTTDERLVVVSITASEARKGLFPLIKKVNEDHDAIEIVSKHGNAVLVSAEDYAALREGAYLLRSPANARRLLKAYENALNGTHLSEHALVDPNAEEGHRSR
jgi:antitoxin YefM